MFRESIPDFAADDVKAQNAFEEYNAGTVDQRREKQDNTPELEDALASANEAATKIEKDIQEKNDRWSKNARTDKPNPN